MNDQNYREFIFQLEDYLKNGIQMNDGKVISFTLVDFYSISPAPAQLLYEFIKKNRIDCYQVKKFLRPINLQKMHKFTIVLKEEIVARNQIINGVLVTSYLNSICTLLKEEGIPLTEGTYMDVFRRIIGDVPIFPLTERIKEKKKM